MIFKRRRDWWDNLVMEIFEEGKKGVSGTMTLSEYINELRFDLKNKIKELRK